MYVIKCHQNHYTKKSDELVGGELFHCIVTMCELKHQSQWRFATGTVHFILVLKMLHHTVEESGA